MTAASASREESTRGDPQSAYASRARELEARTGHLESRLRRLGVLRIATFLAALGFWILGDVLGFASWGALLAALAGAAFVILVRRHRRVRRLLVRAEAARTLQLQGMARLRRDWAALPDPPPPPGDADAHRYAGDLDLFGRASLFQLMGPVYTPMGRGLLESWLLEPTPGEEIPPRQAAVRELATAGVQREEAAVDGSLLDPVLPAALEEFLEWCRKDDLLPLWLGWTAWLLPPLTLALGVGDLLGMVPTSAWLLTLGVQAILARRWGRRLYPAFDEAGAGAPGLRRYHTLLARWEEYEGSSSLLRTEVEELHRAGQPASSALERLGRLLHLVDARLSMLHPFLAAGLLWDVHVAAALERWRRRHGAGVPGWLDALGHLEALSALATLAADHPEWTFPDVDAPGGEPILRARALGHPLLPPDRCVRNDVEVGPPGRVLLVTGSNMAGKSTLLRSIGLAVVLARAGGPVCAEELHLPPLRLFTSMRVRDSLEAGVSYFMAELLRLKALLDAAPTRETGEAREPPLLYLVDEILQGTNSEERRVAGRRLIRHLLRRRAIGAVTTHDLGLHQAPGVEGSAELVHFRESVDAVGEGLVFDYRLRPGLATTRNALKLAERVGLTDPDAPAS